MSKMFLSLLPVLLSLSSLAAANPARPDDAVDSSTPSYDMKAQALLEGAKEIC